MARRTKEEALATRNRLLDAAELLFQAQGVSQTTLQQIAQQAGATRGAIYWHFKDKADLFNAMMERVILPLEAPPKAAALSHDDPLAEIEEGMVHALTLMTTDPQVRRVFDVATHKVEYTHDMASVQQRHLDARNACVVDFEGPAAGRAARPHQAAGARQRCGAGAACADQRTDPELAARSRGLRPRAHGPAHLPRVPRGPRFHAADGGEWRGRARSRNSGRVIGDNVRLRFHRKPISRCISTDRIRPSEG